MATLLKNAVLGLLVATSIGIALVSYKQYGIAWDEPLQRKIGMVNYAYVVKGDQQLQRFDDRDYGPALELALFALEKALRLRTAADIILMRHMAAHLLFILGAAFCFLLIDHLYRNKLLASIAFMLVMLHPRLYAHSFFNTKDIPFLAMFLACFYLCAIAFDKKNITRFILLGIATGLLINLRIIGILFAGCVLLFLAMDALGKKIEKKPAGTSSLVLAPAFLGTTLITLYVTWPFLWANPVVNFVTAIRNMSKFGWDKPVLFKGVYLNPAELPWDYIPTWFAITTPVVYLIAGLFGTALLSFHFMRNPGRFLSNTPERNNLLFFICFFVPIAAVILLDAVLYDGWRHLYFVYGAFAGLMLYGINALLKTRLKTGVIAVLLLSFCATGYFMIENAPFQHVYFNALVDKSSPEKLRRQFELDYWGTSYKQSLEYILNNDASPLIQIAVLNKPGEFNIDILPFEQRKRLKLTENIDEATYLITNFRGLPHDHYAKIESKTFYSIKVCNSSINAVFKLR